MEPRIQYAETEDGVSIAFWTLGDGPPLVRTARVPFGYNALEWQLPQSESYYQRLTARHMLVSYDPRGAGLSGGSLPDQSLPTHLLDLAAVVERLGLETFALYGSRMAGPIAISYAARHPEQVSQLVLWCSAARGADLRREALTDLVEKDQDLYVNALVHEMFGWAGKDFASRYTALIREINAPHDISAAFRHLFELDASAELAKVRCPTLMLHRRQVVRPSLDAVRQTARQIPQARLVLLEGAETAPVAGDQESAVSAIEEFLAGGMDVRGRTPVSGLVTILFTDLTDSTSLTQRLGDAKAQELVRAHNAIVREALQGHRGSEIKHTGDGIMASFPTASGALECAIAIQRAVETSNDANLDVHIGVNAGEPVAEESDLFGTAVQLARRICDHASAGEILVSNVVRELAAGKVFLFADRGDAVLRGFEDPVRLYEARWREDG